MGLRPIITILTMVCFVAFSNPSFGVEFGSATGPAIPADPPSNSLLQVIVQVPEVLVVGQIVPIEVYTLYNGSLTIPIIETNPCSFFPCIRFAIATSQGLITPNVHAPSRGFFYLPQIVEWDHPGEWNTSAYGTFFSQSPGLYTIQIPVNYTLAPNVSVINQGMASFLMQPAQPAQPTPASASDLSTLASTVGTVQTITFGILGVLLLVMVLELLAARKKTRQST